VRSRDDLVAEPVALANQLRALLDSFWPGAAALLADIDSPIALAFLECYPTPQRAHRLGPQRLAAFLARNSWRQPDKLFERLRSAPLAWSDPSSRRPKARPCSTSAAYEPVRHGAATRLQAA
jgi:hypothetical protein